MSKHEAPTSRTFGDTTLHRHQAVRALDGATDLFPWTPGDYLVTDLATTCAPDGEPQCVRFVQLPLTGDAPSVALPGETVERLVRSGVLVPWEYREVPVWGH